MMIGGKNKDSGEILKNVDVLELDDIKPGLMLRGPDNKFYIVIKNEEHFGLVGANKSLFETYGLGDGSRFKDKKNMLSYCNNNIIAGFFKFEKYIGEKELETEFGIKGAL